MQTKIGTIIGISAVMVLAGCNGNDSEVDTSPSRLTLTPALGQVSNASIVLTTVGGSQIAAGPLESGMVTLQIPYGETGPFLATVCGGSGTTYFDEALLTSAPLGATECLRALIPDNASGNVTLSMHSESVVRYFERHGGLAKARPVDIRMKHAAFAGLLGLDETTVPASIGSVSDLLALQRRYTGVDGRPAGLAGEDRYAYLLAILTEAGYLLAQQRGAVPTAPAYAVADQLAADLSDGILDGKDGADYLVSPVYDGLRLNALLSAVMERQLKSQLGEAFPGLDLSSQAGLDYLGDHQLRQPPILQVTRSAPDDALLSWQGSYTGTWHLGGNIETGKQNAMFLPEVYQDYMSQLVEGNPCTIAVSDKAVSLNGLPFAINLQSRSSADEGGVRSFALSRIDNSLVHVEAVGEMLTRADKVKEVGFNVRASSFGLSLDAQVACVVTP